MFHSLRRKRVAVPLAVIASLAVGAVAFAYFTSSGSGTGSATVGTASPFTVSVSPASGGPLYPGSGTETLGYTVTNAGSGNQQLGGTSAAVASSGGNVTQGGTAVAGCSASWFTATNTPPASLPSDLSGGGSTNGSVAVTMQDSGTNQDACQGVQPDISVQTTAAPVSGGPTTATFTGTAGGTLNYTVTPTNDTGTLPFGPGNSVAFDASGNVPPEGSNGGCRVQQVQNGSTNQDYFSLSNSTSANTCSYTLTVNGVSAGSGTDAAGTGVASPVFTNGASITLTETIS